MRVEFDGEPSLSPDPEPGWWVLNAPFRVLVHVGGEVREIVVPKGYRTDLESIPKWTPITRSYLFGVARRAAIPHDYLYSIKAGKDFADDVFDAAMVTEKVNRAVRWILYNAVRIFGHAAYDNEDRAGRIPAVATDEGE